jgi:hypothetical protein
MPLRSDDRPTHTVGDLATAPRPHSHPRTLASAGTTAFALEARRRTLAQCHVFDHVDEVAGTIAFGSGGVEPKPGPTV